MSNRPQFGRPSFWLGAASAIASGLLFVPSRDIGPLGPLVLIAPVPLLVYALTAERILPVAGWSLLGGFLARLSLTLTYGAVFPPMVLILWTTLLPLWFMGLVLVTRWLARDGRIGVALLAYPLATTASEFLFSLSSPHGSAGALGYALTDILPVLQLASFGGVPALSFIAAFVPMALALLICQPKRWREIILLAGLPLIAMLAFGFWRLTLPYDRYQRVALAAIDSLQDDGLSSEALAHANAVTYAALSATLAAQHPDFIVLPEKSLIRQAGWRDTGAPLQAISDQLGTPILAGFQEARADGSKDNVAALYRPGQEPLRYLKRRLIPGLESEFNVGSASLVVGSTGIAICKDMDFAPMIGEYGQAGVDLMLVPAWDFRGDARLHARMAVVRGVENGFAMARAAANGLLTLTDANGRWVAERVTDADQPASLVAEIGLRKERTIYSQVGDLFGWATVAGFLLVVILRFVPSYSRAGQAKTRTHQQTVSLQ